MICCHTHILGCGVVTLDVAAHAPKTSWGIHLRVRARVSLMSHGAPERPPPVDGAAEPQDEACGHDGSDIWCGTAWKDVVVQVRRAGSRWGRCVGRCPRSSRPPLRRDRVLYRDLCVNARGPRLLWAGVRRLSVIAPVWRVCERALCVRLRPRLPPSSPRGSALPLRVCVCCWLCCLPTAVW